MDGGGREKAARDVAKCRTRVPRALASVCELLKVDTGITRYRLDAWIGTVCRTWQPGQGSAPPVISGMHNNHTVSDRTKFSAKSAHKLSSHNARLDKLVELKIGGVEVFSAVRLLEGISNVVHGWRGRQFRSR
jgi:hypothetical protein